MVHDDDDDYEWGYNTGEPVVILGGMWRVGVSIIEVQLVKSTKWATVLPNVACIIGEFGIRGRRASL